MTTDNPFARVKELLPPDRSLVLVGLMGAGKSSIGRRLARRLNLPFVDADVEIEAAAGKSVSDIFAEHGEAHFREGETKVIARLLNERRMVLATGGGAFMNADTRARIAEKGISVWLRADLDLLVERTSRRKTRPLLRERDPRAVLADLIEARYPTYALADITVESREVPHDEMVRDVAVAVADYLESTRVDART